MNSLCLPGNDPCKKSIQYCVDFSPDGSLYFSLQFNKEKGNKAVKVRLIIFTESSTSEPITRKASTTPHPQGKGGDGK
jgi:hypothetical protein|tara:strand:- start:414 stop:647 length:234 start_codon:yes stop_codon:yes gene_type:complete